MISDSYLLCDQLLTHRPSKLVLAVTPRDFSDNDQKTPYRTATFKKLVTLSNSPKYIRQFAKSPSDYGEILATLVCPLFKFRNAATTALNIKASSVLKLIGRASQYDEPKTAEAIWQRSIEEYKWRYANISEASMAQQFGFLELLLSTCRQRSIDVVLVNLPVTEANQSLIPNDVTQGFSARLKSAGDKWHMQTLDLTNMHLPDSDYYDSVHLNKIGAPKVWKQIEPALSQAGTN